jgi:hypothetical protein
MSNKLTTLLSLPTVKRTASDYENMYDDFIRFAGGYRVAVECHHIVDTFSCQDIVDTRPLA